MSTPLNVAIIWHMHQPMYLSPDARTFRMPWVRLHAVKDYLDMLLMARECDGARMTFNFTPSLLRQIEMYLGGTPELHAELTLRDAADLTLPEKTLILKDFFMANWETMIKPFPRYQELHVKRGRDISDDALAETVRFFSDQDFTDLQVLFNLTWVDPLLRSRDPFLDGLVKKGRRFNAGEKRGLIEKHYEIMARIVPEYRAAVQEGSIEVSVSPYYHPILPLLIDTSVARISDPSIPLPSSPFSRPDDARAQIARAVEFAGDRFGARPAGMWPSEGSVSEDALALMAEEGISWAASDEQVLRNSLALSGRQDAAVPADQLYRVWRYDRGVRPIHMLFRDRRLSDNIGFLYSDMVADDAVGHFIAGLHGIRSALADRPSSDECVVPVILDGENAWEYYEDDAGPFLTKLYRRISDDSAFRLVTVSDAVRQAVHPARLDHVSPGSWINANFRIWMGHAEDNKAWDILVAAREALEQARAGLPQERFDAALESLYAAEGSDWNWWYGDEHATEFDIEFDELFRSYVRDVYVQCGIAPPAGLDSPLIEKDKQIRPEREMQNFVTPRIDGRVSSYYEWLGSAMFNMKKYGSAMHRTTTYVESMYIGFDADNMYLRLDPERGIPDDASLHPFTISFVFPEKQCAVTGTLDADHRTSFGLVCGEAAPVPLDASAGKVLELRIPLREAGFAEQERLAFYVDIRSRTLDNYRFPSLGTIGVTVPSREFEEYFWQA